MPITGIDRVNQAFTKYLLEQQENAIEEAIDILSRIGEECVSEARTNGKYTDRTGNLRSSIGFAVLRDGKVAKMSSFNKVHGQGENSQIVDFTLKSGKNKGKRVRFHVKGASGDGSEGVVAGKALINQLASQFNTGLALIVVAGMGYAVYVEAKALNVLNSAQDLGETLAPQMLREAGLIK